MSNQTFTVLLCIGVFFLGMGTKFLFHEKLRALITKKFPYIILLAVVGLSFWVAMAALRATPIQWATIATALSVITSALAASTARSVAEIQLDSKRPKLRLSVDTQSRYRFMLLRIKNHGGSDARDISIEWENPLKDSRGKLIRFNPDESEDIELKSLLSSEEWAVLIDDDVRFFGEYRDQNLIYTGVIRFKDSAGKSLEEKFLLNFKQLQNSLTYRNEELKAHVQLQKIPTEINKLYMEVEKIAQRLKSEAGKSEFSQKELTAKIAAAFNRGQETGDNLSPSNTDG